ncbi:MAG: oligosaccharide flippase family protein [Sphingomonadaceae bacterium]|nr:oligosaccharide flippase family protein [Sphingomonadaceae bacterium]
MIALVWLNLLSIMAIPIYIRILGVSEWGIVAACLSLQMIASFVDAGFSQIIPRWVAREAHNPAALRSYVKVFGKIYAVLALCIFVFIQSSAEYFAHHWFDIQANRADNLELAIRITCFQIFFQFLNSLAVGFWHGMQHQVTANVRTCFFGTLKHALTMIVLISLQAEAHIYASVFALVALIELLANGHRLRSSFIMDTSGKQHIVHIIPFLREVSMLSLGVLVGLMVSYIDRIVLSRSVTLDHFGIYSIIVSISMAFLQLQIPFTRAYFPVLVREFEKKSEISIKVMKKLTILILFSSVIPCITASLFADLILKIWLNNEFIVEVGSETLRMLLLAVAINSLYGCVYQALVASGKSRLVLQINVAALFAGMSVVALLRTSTGLNLGGMIWLATASTQLILGSVWLAWSHRRSCFSSLTAINR